jgi:hypothetical protein
MEQFESINRSPSTVATEGSSEERLILRIAQSTYLGQEFAVELESSVVKVYLVLHVVSGSARKGIEIDLSLAHKLGLECDIGDELLFDLYYLECDKEMALEQHRRFSEAYDFASAYRDATPLRTRTISSIDPVPY